MRVRVANVIVISLLGACAVAEGDDAVTDAEALGARPVAGGVEFRVWALHADRVFVMGEFNGWSQTRNELTMGAGGYFSGVVSGARVGQKYKFVIHNDGQVLIKADPRAARMENSVGASIIHDPDAYAWQHDDFEPPPVSQQVIYEMHVGAFNPTTAGRPGTWQSAIQRLDHVAALGANMIELMPIAEFPGDWSWGYNPSWPFAPEMIYGTPEDMKRFVDEAHARGIGVIVDVVHNHWGRGDLGMRCFDGTSCGAGQNGIYFYTDARGTTAWGPRPDYGRAEVRRYIIDNAVMWLDEYRADGLRWDSTSNIRGVTEGNPVLPDGERLLRDVNSAIDQLVPHKIQIAEDLKRMAALTAPTASGGYGFDSQWDPAFYWPVAEAVLATDDARRDVAAVGRGLATIDGGDATRRVIYSESHDSVANGRRRLPEMIDPAAPASLVARKRSTLAASMVMTTPGVPMLLQGQEFLESGTFSDRQALDWSKATTHAGILAMYRDLIALRRNLGGRTAGLAGSGIQVFHTNANAHVFAFHRWANGGPGDDVVVIANFNGRAYPSYTIGFPRAGTWRVRFNGDSRRYGTDFGGTISNTVTAVATPRDGLPYSATVGVGAYSIVVLSQ